MVDKAVGYVTSHFMENGGIEQNLMAAQPVPNVVGLVMP